MQGENGSRKSMSQEDRRRLFERTTEAANEYIDAEKRAREAKTERLRIARMQAQEQSGEL